MNTIKHDEAGAKANAERERVETKPPHPTRAAEKPPVIVVKDEEVLELKKQGFKEYERKTLTVVSLVDGATTTATREFMRPIA